MLSGYGSLCAGGASFVSAVIGSMVASARTADAPKLSRDVPEVDRLAVRMVTDNIVIQFVPPETRHGVAIERRSRSNTTDDAPPRTALNGEWGLSMHAESQRGGEVRNVLVDFGYTPEVLLNNLAILGIDASTLDALVLSHGHYDHFGGMVGFLKSNKGTLRKDTPFFVGETKRSTTAKKANVPTRMRAIETAISGVCLPSFVAPAIATKSSPHR
jgi:7,8-dihydropterin-6-yl-methyl-4-(beta-D-ribofuranosyl)aminobenzene 5'-phosphate synthase